MRIRLALVMALVIGASAVGTALGDRGGRHRRRHWGHERSDRGWHGHRRQAFYWSKPDVYYAPPPVIYAPAYPSPGINFIFPLRFR